MLYKAAMLGASGSGKTVFLASMFKMLSVQTKETGFFLEASSPDHRRILANKYAEITNPNIDWPEGTSRDEVSDWRFQCVTNSKGQNFPVFEFSYLDYAGGHITEGSDDDSTSFSIDHEAKTADAILVLLDGMKLLHLMQGTELPKGLLPIDYDLSHIMPILNSLDPKPVHFVISKWDLLEGKYSLNKVRERLMGFPEFRGIISQRRTMDIPTRLIPVSALGVGFASLDTQGQMKKNRFMKPRPFQVEMPIACILVDGFQKAYHDFIANQEKPLFKLKISLMKAMQILGMFGGTTAPLMAVLLPHQFRLGQIAVSVLSDLVVRGVGHRMDSLKVVQQQNYELVRDQESAMASVISSYGVLMAKLESAFPESDMYSV